MTTAPIEFRTPRDIYEQAVVQPVASPGSGQALSLPKGESRDFLAEIHTTGRTGAQRTQEAAKAERG
jgi:hypothetical protein